MRTTDFPIRKYFSPQQAYLLVCSILTYLLGISVAHYLGEGIDWSVFGSGLIWVIFIQVAVGLAHSYFCMVIPAADNLPPKTAEELEARRKASLVLLGLITALLTATALITFSLFQNHSLNPMLIVVMFAAILLALVVVLPPIRLITRGYGELVIAILICYLVPFIGFFLQSEGSAQLLSLSAMPLTMIFLATIITLEFEHYGSDCMYCHTNLLVKLGWQWGGKLHAILILAAYLLLGIGYLNNLPWRVVSPVLFTSILAVLQIYLVNRLLAGEKPVWRLINASAIAFFLLTVYLFAYSFWMV